MARAVPLSAPGLRPAAISLRPLLRSNVGGDGIVGGCRELAYVAGGGMAVNVISAAPALWRRGSGA